MVAEAIGDFIALEVPHYQKALVAVIPGSRWSMRMQRWELPLTWGSCLALRAQFGAELEVGPALHTWAWKCRTRMHDSEAVKSETPEGRYGYQETGIRWLRAVGSALLGDEMGLGKSRQAILAVKEFPCLVVCPNSVKYTWKDEVEKWRPECSVSVVSGTAPQRKKQIAMGADFTVINWEALKSESRLEKFGSMTLTDVQKKPGLLNREWGCVIADEAHRAKDPKSQQTRALWAVGASSAQRIALTGTPVANSPLDLWSIMRFVSPTEWPSRSKFIDRYCVAGLNFWGGLDVTQLRADTKDELWGFFDPRFLRRTKEEVLPWLPEMVRQTRYVEMGTSQQKAYSSMLKEQIAMLDSGALVATDPMTRTMRLLQMASATPVLDSDGKVGALAVPSCKLDAVKDILDERDGRPVVFFTVSRKLAELLSEKCGVKHIMITGRQSAEERAEAITAFQTGAIPAAFATVGAGGEGITLTAADMAVFVQRPWSLVQSLQAESRIHRIGQSSSSVAIVDIITVGTVEASVHRLLGDKEKMLQEIVRDSSRLAKLWGGETVA